MDAFTDSFNRVIGIEGRYSNNPKDSGGETMWGITKRTALAHGYTGPMRTMPVEVAREIYKRGWWDEMRMDAIAPLMPRLAEELFDSAVNVGVTRSSSWLQAALNGLNIGGALYPDLAVDGHIGNVTLTALRSLYQHRGGKAEIAVRRLCDCQQGAYYLWLTQQREKDEEFLFGWVMNRLGGE
jgi:lysozyme family protein